ncbi:hypothetical protein ANO11243_067090 [Dothideomycetidae sp. 11243]|nr:hypothetical protein ANO11243_067090 [fungal sp. No.11243]
MIEKAAWHDAYPQPRNQSPTTMQREELISRFRHGEHPGLDFLLIDLRRTDHEGGTIRGSINLPAQSVYNSLPTLLNICKASKIDTVVWYCEGSSQGRGTRAAAWFDDLLQNREVTSVKSVVLLGGIAGWVQAGQDYTDLMDEYNAASWKRD